MDQFRMGHHWDKPEGKYYRLTRAGQKELQGAEESFEQLTKGIRGMMCFA